MITRELTHKWIFDSEEDFEKFKTFKDKLDDKSFSFVMSYCLNKYLLDNGFNNLVFNNMEELFEDSTEIPIRVKSQEEVSLTTVTSVSQEEASTLLSAISNLTNLMMSGAINISKTVDNVDVNKIVQQAQSTSTILPASMGEIIDIEPSYIVSTTSTVEAPRKKKKKGVNLGALSSSIGRMTNK